MNFLGPGLPPGATLAGAGIGGSMAGGAGSLGGSMSPVAPAVSSGAGMSIAGGKVLGFGNGVV